MLATENLACIRDNRTLFAKLELQLSPGEIVQLAGPNGAGKTSLLRILAGLAEPDMGRVLWQHQPILNQRQAYYRQLLYIGHQAGLKQRLTPLENLSFYQALQGGGGSDASLWLALEQVGLLGLEELPAGQLSAGQQRRVALARLWLSAAPLWILDEPLTAIDRDGVLALAALFGRHCRAGGMVLLTTHQPLPECGVPVRKLDLSAMEAMACSG